MKQQKPFLAGILLFMTGLAACSSTEIGNSRDVNQDRIYMDYQIDYNEAANNVILNFKYRFAGPAGTTLVLNEPSRAELDAVKLVVDSTEFSGAFYRVEKTFSHYTGKHMISFIDMTGKKLEDSFEIAPFNINVLPANTHRGKDLVITYKADALGFNDLVEINSEHTDSSFTYRSGHTGNRIVIPAKELLRQRGETLALSCSVYREVPLQQTTAEGGSLKMRYKLKPMKIKLLP